MLPCFCDKKWELQKKKYEGHKFMLQKWFVLKREVVSHNTTKRCFWLPSAKTNPTLKSPTIWALPGVYVEHFIQPMVKNADTQTREAKGMRMFLCWKTLGTLASALGEKVFPDTQVVSQLVCKWSLHRTVYFCGVKFNTWKVQVHLPVGQDVVRLHFHQLLMFHRWIVTFSFAFKEPEIFSCVSVNSPKLRTIHDNNIWELQIRRKSKVDWRNFEIARICSELSLQWTLVKIVRRTVRRWLHLEPETVWAGVITNQTCPCLNLDLSPRCWPPGTKGNCCSGSFHAPTSYSRKHFQFYRFHSGCRVLNWSVKLSLPVLFCFRACGFNKLYALPNVWTYIRVHIRMRTIYACECTQRSLSLYFVPVLCNLLIFAWSRTTSNRI